MPAQRAADGLEFWSGARAAVFQGEQFSPENFLAVRRAVSYNWRER